MLRKQEGFTLVELVIVIVIIGILAAIAIPKFADLSTSAQIAACRQNQEAVESACTIYYTRSAVDPTSVGLAVGDPAQYPSAPADLTGNALLDAWPNCALPAGGPLTLTAPPDGTVICPNGC